MVLLIRPLCFHWCKRLPNWFKFQVFFLMSQTKYLCIFIARIRAFPLIASSKTLLLPIWYVASECVFALALHRLLAYIMSLKNVMNICAQISSLDVKKLTNASILKIGMILIHPIRCALSPISMLLCFVRVDGVWWGVDAGEMCSHHGMAVFDFGIGIHSIMRAVCQIKHTANNPKLYI